MASPAAGSPEDGGMGPPSNYSLRWNNHQTHIMSAFEQLLQHEHLVDVTLVCSNSTIRAHKIVLSICSPFFERIFAEHPCKHPVIVLKDFSSREMNSLIDFMYRGEVRVERQDLNALMSAAESLQIRGLTSSEPQPVTPPRTPAFDMLLDDPAPAAPRSSTPELPREQPDSRSLVGPLADGLSTEDDEENPAPESPAPLPLTVRDPLVAERDDRLAQLSHLSFNHREILDPCPSPPLPRRKQARPRRRSGELVPQDLSRPHQPPSRSPHGTGLNLSNHNHSQSQQLSPQSQPETQAQHQQHEPRHRSPTSHNQSQHQQQQELEEHEEEAENLSMKKEPRHSRSPSRSAEPPACKSESEEASSPRDSPALVTPGNLHPDAPFADLPAVGLTAMSGLSMAQPQHHSNEYLTSLGQFAAQWLPPGAGHQQPQQQQQNHLTGGGGTPQSARHPRSSSPHGKPAAAFPYQQCESPMTPRAAFGMDGLQPIGATAGLFHHGGPLELHDSFKPESFHGLFVGASLGHHHSGKKSKKHRSGDGLMRRWSDHSRGGGLPMCRPKGQHSAPRGGPPRSWTNSDLTDALTMVWNKRMTTSQASRVFGIPYNSLLMYVRGKYGKSLKLEQLRRECAEGEVTTINNNVKLAASLESASPRLPPPPGGLPGPPPPPAPGHPAEAEASFGPPPHPSLLGAAGLGHQGFFPDFASFPVPVNMVHLLPPSEQNAFEPPAPGQAGPPSNGSANGHHHPHGPGGHLSRQQQQDNSSPRNRSRSPSPMELPLDGGSPSPLAMSLAGSGSRQPTPTAALLQHNGPAAVE